MSEIVKRAEDEGERGTGDSAIDGRADRGKRETGSMYGWCVGDRGEGCIYSADGAESAIHIGDTSVADDDNRPT
jgi:hypothetical protein